jgi:type IV pilus assembly protein PilC
MRVFHSKKVVEKNAHSKRMGPPQSARMWNSFMLGLLGSTNSVRLSIHDKTFFVKRLSFLIRAGIPILDSLLMLRSQTASKSYSRVIDIVIDDISNGQFLSNSLGKFPRTFGNFIINIIRVGEMSGILSQNLDYLAEELKKRQILRRKIVGAFMYPIVISVATIGITGMLVGYIFPKIMPIFSGMKVTLPLSTQIVISISDYMRNYGLITLIGVGIAGILLSLCVKYFRPMRYAYHFALLRLPIIGPMVRSYNLANVTRTLGLLLRSGILLGNSVEIAKDTTENVVYQHALIDIGKTIDRGERLSMYMTSHPVLFPDLMTQLVGVGERTGSLSDTLVYLSELYEGEVDNFAKNLSSLLEPILMVIMGIIVGFIAISVISPIYAITQHIST